MNIAITGGTGFLGLNLARFLIQNGHFPTVISRGLSKNTKAVQSLSNINYQAIGLKDQSKLYYAFNGCDAVAHLAGINKEISKDDFKDCHVDATERVIYAARKASVKKILLVSYLNARPHKNSKYHQSKWEAEELVRGSGLDYTILKPGMIYGAGDHMISHINRALSLTPFFSPVGIFSKKVSPIYVDDMTEIMAACLLEDRLSGGTYSVVGPEALGLGTVVSKIAKAQGKLAISIPFPVLFHLGLAKLCELTSKNPLVTVAQIKMLSEGMDKCIYGNSEQLPEDLQPKTYLTEKTILDILKV